MRASQNTKTALGVAAVVVLGILFWALLLGPKRDEASELSERSAAIGAEVDAERSRVLTGLAAKRSFPRDYQELVIVGKAVPRDDDTASLLVQLQRLGLDAQTRFVAIEQAGSGGGGGASAVAAGGEEPLPIGASVGAAGLPAVPYELDFQGGFFQVANFIHGVDDQVRTVGNRVVAKGRLITIDGFLLKPDGGSLASRLAAEFKITTYVAPPGEGLTGGATAEGPLTAGGAQ